MSDTRTVTLTEFLLARIAEDEEIAKRAGWGYGAGWTSEIDEVEDWSTVHADSKRDMVGCEDGDVTRHIARHDPARVLAECAAKRRIVDAHRAGFPDEDRYAMGWHDMHVWALHQLASVYADHRDFRDDWRG